MDRRPGPQLRGQGSLFTPHESFGRFNRPLGLPGARLSQTENRLWG